MKKLEPIDLIVFDLETSGFVAPESKIIEIGAYIFYEGKSVPVGKQWVLNNGIEIPEKITEITGITQEIIEAEGKDPTQCLEEFMPLLINAKKNVTHNGIRFDIPFLIAYATDLIPHTPEEIAELTQTLRSRAYDTAVHCKAVKLGMCPDTGEDYLSFADRVMKKFAKGVHYNLALSCEERKIDTSNVEFHRAFADVAMTYELYKVIQEHEAHLLQEV